MRRRISKEQWLAYAFLLLLVLTVVAGVLAPDRDIYHGARQLAGTVESSEAIQASGLGGTFARLHVRLDDGSETIACTAWGVPLEKGVKVVLRKGMCVMDPDGNLAIRADLDPGP